MTLQLLELVSKQLCGIVKSKKRKDGTLTIGLYCVVPENIHACPLPPSPVQKELEFPGDEGWGIL